MIIIFQSMSITFTHINNKKCLNPPWNHVSFIRYKHRNVFEPGSLMWEPIFIQIKPRLSEPEGNLDIM